MAEHHRAGTLLPVRSEGRLEPATEPPIRLPQVYGTALDQALFREGIRDAFVRARNEDPDGAVRVLIFVEDEQSKVWRWEWLCAPLDDGRWDFLSLDQRALFSLYLPSLTDRAYPPIGPHDLRALMVVANPADPAGSYGLAAFDVDQNLARLQAIFGQRIPADVLARAPGAVGAPALDALVKQLTEGSSQGPYTI